MGKPPNADGPAVGSAPACVVAAVATEKPTGPAKAAIVAPATRAPVDQRRAEPLGRLGPTTMAMAPTMPAARINVPTHGCHWDVRASSSRAHHTVRRIA